ncbi:MAG: hypothetical protein ACYCTB_01830 [bacterium]
MDTLKSLSLMKISDSFYVKGAAVVSIQIVEDTEGYYAAFTLYNSGEIVRSDTFEKRRDLIKWLDLEPDKKIEAPEDPEIEKVIKTMAMDND